MPRLLSLVPSFAAVVALGCGSPATAVVESSPTHLTPPPASAPLDPIQAPDDQLRAAAAHDLHCDAAEVHTSVVPLYRHHLYAAEGCGQRAIYAPLFGSTNHEVGVFMISRFAL